jgi:hypothetical protein
VGDQAGAAMSPLSADPDRRRRQLANLRNAPRAPLGNQRALRHGAYASITERELDAKTRAIFDALSADAPVRELDGGLPRYDTFAVRLLAENRVRRDRVSAEELRHGIEDKDGGVRSICEFGLRLDHQALELARELGMTPASRAKLGLDLARTTETLGDYLSSNYGSTINGKEAS